MATSTRTINKLMHMAEGFLDDNPELFDYAEYDCPYDVIVRLDETFSPQHWNDTSLCPEGIATIHEALMLFLHKKWNDIDDRITKAGGNSFENRIAVISEVAEESSFEDILMAPYRRMTDPDYMRKRALLKESHPYLVDQLSFGFCAEDGETRSIEISLDSDELYVKAENGFNGIFIYRKDAKIT